MLASSLQKAELSPFIFTPSVHASLLCSKGLSGQTKWSAAQQSGKRNKRKRTFTFLPAKNEKSSKKCNFAANFPFFKSCHRNLNKVELIGLDLATFLHFCIFSDIRSFTSLSKEI